MTIHAKSCDSQKEEAYSTSSSMPETLLVESGADQAPTLVCLGDSITYGMGVKAPERDAWPALLQEKLGTSWNVVNLGVSGTTLLDEGGRPYRATGNVARALQLDPSMAIIMLGTNDSVDPAWSAEAYRTQLDGLVNEIVEASSHDVRIVLMAPPCTFFGPDDPRHRDTMNALVGGEMRDIVKTIARERGAQFIDMYAFTEGHSEWFPDDLHPNEAGNVAMVGFVFDQIFG